MIQKLSENLTLVVGILTAIGTLFAMRKNVYGIFSGIRSLYISPRRILEMMTAQQEAAGRRDELLKKIHYALFNDGQGGIVQQVARLSACHTAAFESSIFPSFECSSKGITTRVNDAYRKLVGNFWNGSIVSAGSWNQVIYGELAAAYRAEFERASRAKEDFIAVCDFQNPKTGEHRGRWRVHAPAAQIGDDCLYVGRFVAAEDEAARNIARHHGWSVRQEED